MAKVAVVVFADTESHADLARVVNAMITVRESKEANDEVHLIFDGAGTKWIGELAKPEHQSYRLYESVKDKITGVCAFCAGAFGATEAVKAERITLLDEYKRHPSLRKLIVDEYQVLIF